MVMMMGLSAGTLGIFSIASLLLLASTTLTAQAEQVSNWQAYLEPHPTQPDTKYRLVFEWDHIHDETIFVDGEKMVDAYTMRKTTCDAMATRASWPATVNRIGCLASFPVP